MISILFSPKPFVGQDAVNQRNALTSWRREIPDAELICYGEAEGVADACREFGATLVKDLPLTETGAPRFDWIVRHAAEHAKHDLQMFINADIFLMSGFRGALAKIPFSQFLAISDRLNVPLDLLSESPLADAKTTLLRLVGSGEAEMNGGAGSDFFIFRRGFWRNLPPIAVGRAQYDNALMAYCVQQRKPLVDVTNAILPLHPKHGYGHVKGGRNTTYNGPDVGMNGKLVGNGAPPLLSDASHLLMPDGIFENRCFHGLTHRILVRTQQLHPHNWPLRILVRTLDFMCVHMYIARPKTWNAQEIVTRLYHD